MPQQPVGRQGQNLNICSRGRPQDGACQVHCLQQTLQQTCCEVHLVGRLAHMLNRISSAATAPHLQLVH